MYKSYQFRMYPNKQQIIMIQKTFDMIKELPNLYPEYPFLKEVDSCSLRCSLFDLEDAFNRYFRHQNNDPKFKGKYGSKRSYRIILGIKIMIQSLKESMVLKEVIELIILRVLIKERSTKI